MHPWAAHPGQGTSGVCDTGSGSSLGGDTHLVPVLAWRGQGTALPAPWWPRDAPTLPPGRDKAGRAESPHPRVPRAGGTQDGVGIGIHAPQRLSQGSRSTHRLWQSILWECGSRFHPINTQLLPAPCPCRARHPPVAPAAPASTAVTPNHCQDTKCMIPLTFGEIRQDLPRFGDTS